MDTRTDAKGRPERRDAGYWQAFAESMTSSRPSGEFPVGADLPPPGLDRRSFLRLLGASMALAGLGGCIGQVPQKIVPYVRQPPEICPGVSDSYATTMCLEGYGIGLLVESHEGRPTKIEGNPDHPASLGACGLMEQASILQLYDPDRARSPRHGHAPCSWSAVDREISSLSSGGGHGLFIVLEPTSSPLIMEQIADLRHRCPHVRIIIHDSMPTAGSLAAHKLFGRRLVPLLGLEKAQVIVALDADLLTTGPFCHVHARAFANGRRARTPGQEMSRFYVAESSPTSTSSCADHRLCIQDSDMATLAAALLLGLLPDGDARRNLPGLAGLAASHGGAEWNHWVRTVAMDLKRHRGKALVVAGRRQNAAVHALVAAINEIIGGAGAVTWREDPLITGDGDLADLRDALLHGAVENLLLLSGDPALTAPGNLQWSLAQGHARRRFHLGMYDDGSIRDGDWSMPSTHYLESWGDARALDGTASLQQPLIEPLAGARSVSDVLAVVLGDGQGPRERLLASWNRRWHGGTSHGVPGPDAEIRFQRCLQRGVINGTANAIMPATVDWRALESLMQARPMRRETTSGRRWELALRVDTKIQDGRFANNPWLQELPDPITKLTWDNAAWISPHSAEVLGITDGSVVELAIQGRRILIPALIVPGQTDEVVSVALGFGRPLVERTAAGIGVDAYPLRSHDEPWSLPGLAVRVTGETRSLATTQQHWRMDGRPIVMGNTQDAYSRSPAWLADRRIPPATIRPAEAGHGRQWGMIIDLSVCTGCSACVVACQAENNIPVVGRENVLLGREMHWLRIDRYYRGEKEAPSMVSMPMACQQCEKAPCEYVCPTYATVHSSDGLNEMIYNRCVGTRFCSNNCPYKVRRFNWYDFHEGEAPLVRMVHNPDVTVRDRGVMEKCTYCVQRIREAEIADTIGHPRDRGVKHLQTACQQTCPTRAIDFGDINDPGTAVHALRQHPLAYGVLEETGTVPRTLYLARINNPGPDLP